jgi:hypothetical protein
MRARRSTLLLTGLVMAGLWVGTAGSALADATTTATAGGTTVNVTIPNVVFEGPNCMNAPVRAAFEEVESFATIHLAVAPGRANDALSTSLVATTSGPLEDSLQICPRVDPAGVYNVTGTLNTSVAAAPFAPSSFMVSKAATRFLTLTATQLRRTLSVRGRVVALTNSGTVPAAGSIRIFGFLSKARGGTGRWTAIGKAYPDKMGAFSVSGTTNRRLSGMYVRAQLVPDFWCLSSARSVRIP